MTLLDGADIGARVRAARKERDWSLRLLAQRAGVSFAYISHLEKGRYPRPSVEKLEQIAKAFEIGLEELLGVTRDGEPDGKTPVSMNEIRAAYNPRGDSARLFDAAQRLVITNPAQVLEEFATLPSHEQDLVVDLIHALYRGTQQGRDAGKAVK